ncbi:MAG TPA: phospholipase D-like domain-containing protein [Gemmatimonadales bacterium]|jgi:cardiolipin synthase|nr:phospholipase D-like domain-containing protein [Gemmatimonadales bacterium]
MPAKRSRSTSLTAWTVRWRRLRAAEIALGVGVAAVLAILWLALASSERKLERPIAHSYAVGDSQFVRTMGSLLGPGFVPGNRTTALYNGDQVFPAMLGAIRAARRTITFESYIYWSSSVGRQFTAALTERARAGVRTHVLIDWAGSQKVDQDDVARLREAGVEVVFYRPLRFYQLDRVNHRTHRKLLIVDGRVGFTGGLGVADQWLGHAQDENHWRDSHFRVEGPVVAQLQAAFMDDWFETEGEVLDGPGYFPDLDRQGPQLGQVFWSSPRGGNGNLRVMFLLAIAAASRRILIANSYFVPDETTVAMLAAAARRGVEVEIIVPGPILDAQVVRRASRGMWQPMLEAGVRIYEYQPTMYHTKVTVVDDRWVSVGSTNFDDRSFRLNQEANLNVYDADFGAEQAAAFARDRAQSRRITLDQWRHRPLRERLEERIAGLMRKQL